MKDILRIIRYINGLSAVAKKNASLCEVNIARGDIRGARRCERIATEAIGMADKFVPRLTIPDSTRSPITSWIIR